MIKFIIIILIIVFLYILQVKPKSNFTNTNNLYAYVINLDKDTSRLKNITENLNKNNIAFERFSAINGRLVKKLNPKYFNNNGLSLPQVGCALSHIKIWEKIINEKNTNKVYLIMEDDAYVVDNFTNKLITYMKQLNNFDLIYLGANKVYGEKYSENFIKPINKVGYNFGFFGYLVNYNGVKKLYEQLLPTNDPLDKEIKEYYKKLNIYTANPPLIKHNYEYFSNLLGKKRNGETKMREKVIIVNNNNG